MSDRTHERVPLFRRLPAIYQIRDAELETPGQLQAYLSLVEEVYGALHENIEALYDDLFIETCAEWAIPYVGDLLGTSHLKGDPWTLRADVADTIALRRRKGTAAGLERLVRNLTRWGVHVVELRERTAWTQHLNHQRPDAGGGAPLVEPGITTHTPVRGGTVPLRDPAMLALQATAFDPFARLADLRPALPGQLRVNLPNTAVFLWRLAAYRVPAAEPGSRHTEATGAASLEATHAVRFVIDPLARPVTLFGAHDELASPGSGALDRTPGPIPAARLTQQSEAGRPKAYVTVNTYDPDDPEAAANELARTPLVLHLPVDFFADPEQDIWPGPLSRWTIRGANLCAWEDGLRPPLGEREIAIDPANGRIVIGAAGSGEADALEESLRVSYTYGAPGPVGAHPIARDPLPDVTVVDLDADPSVTLTSVLSTLHTPAAPEVIEIRDSRTHEIDVAAVEAGSGDLHLFRSVTIRAGGGHRPVLRLSRPLRFQPVDPSAGASVSVRLEGLFITPGTGFPGGSALITRAAVNRLELVGCTLDPGGHRLLQPDGSSARAPVQTSLELSVPYGFSDADEAGFDQTPEVVLGRSISGPLRLDRRYRLTLEDSIVDAGVGVPDLPGDAFALTHAGDPTGDYGPPTEVRNVTLLGRTRVTFIHGHGAVFVHALEVLNSQRGCLRTSYFAAEGAGRPENRLPQHVGCVHGADARLAFESEWFGEPAYGRLHSSSDFDIRERGPGDDAMGTFNFLLEAHKWRNLQIRLREFMPVGVRPLLISVT